MSFMPSVADRAEWRACSPHDGWAQYVDALTSLGLDMAQAVPKKIRDEAIPPLTEIPKSNLLVGDFAKGTTTKERTLSHG